MNLQQQLDALRGDFDNIRGLLHSTGRLALQTSHRVQSDSGRRSLVSFWQGALKEQVATLWATWQKNAKLPADERPKARPLPFREQVAWEIAKYLQALPQTHAQNTYSQFTCSPKPSKARKFSTQSQEMMIRPCLSYCASATVKQRTRGSWVRVRALDAGADGWLVFSRCGLRDLTPFPFPLTSIPNPSSTALCGPPRCGRHGRNPRLYDFPKQCAQQSWSNTSLKCTFV